MAYPRKWEYDVDEGLSTSASPEELVQHLDAMGAEGWELVAIDERESLYRCVYKRPIRGEEEYEDDYEDEDYEDDEEYNEEDYDEDGSIRVNPPPPEQPKGFWGRR